MTEATPMVTLLGAALYPYGAALAGALLLAAALALCSFRKVFGKAEDGLRFALWAIPCGFVGARLGYCAVKSGFIAVDYGWRFLIRFDLGGYSMAGAFLGVLLAAWLFARVAKHDFARVADAAVPPLLLAAALARAAEALTSEGIGDYIDDELWQRFPFAVADVYGDFRFPVFVWEALTALILCAVVWRLLSRRGDASLVGMLLFSATQILWESLRRDSFLRFGFVRVNQLWCIAMPVAAIVLWTRRARLSRGKVALTVAGVAVVIGVLIALEFAFDKSTIDNGVLYAIMAATLVLASVGGLLLRRAAARQSNREESLHA